MIGCLSSVHSFSVTHSNPYPSRTECCNPGLFTLHRPPPLHDCHGERFDDYKCREAPAGCDKDLVISVGLPVPDNCFVSVLSRSLSTSCLHGCNSKYVASSNRCNISEDFGPVFALVDTPPTFIILFYAWPVAIGTVSCRNKPAPLIPLRGNRA